MAHHLGAAHAVTLVGGRFNRARFGRTYETRPTASRVELVVAAEERLAARDAAVRARIVMIPILPRKCALRALATRNRVCLWAQELLPLAFGSFHLAGHVSEHNAPPRQLLPRSLASPLDH